MDIKISEKQIKNLCGTVSFKKGQTFYQTGKVNFLQDTDVYGEAVVNSTEQFVVRVEKEGTGQFKTSCSCPTLGNFSKSCQHVAAVLIAIFNNNKNKAQSMQVDENAGNLISENSFLSIFKQETIQTTRQQSHFEKREILEVQFLLAPVQLSEQDPFFSIQLQINGEQILSIREFLSHIKNKKPYRISQNITYNFEQFCFEEQHDAILQLLIKIVEDDTLYSDTPVQNQEQHLLIIPPSSWFLLATLISNTENVSLLYQNESYSDVKLQTQPTALRFFIEAKGKDYQVYIEGIKRVFLLPNYRVVLFDGEMTQMSDDSMKQLFELRQMLQQQTLLTIEHSHWDYFREQVIPKLKKIGIVEMAPELSAKQMETPLVANIYLDRVKNRFLAGVEFQYGQFVIQPLDDQLSDEVFIFRDIEKEAAVLALMDGSGFTKTDGGYYMQNEELEYEFLYHQLPKLTKLANIYATNSVKLRIAKENNFPKIRVNVQKERTNWLEFKFEMDGVTNKQIKEILAAIKVKQKYYRLQDGALLSLETKEIEEIQRFLRAIPAQDDEYELTFNMPILDSLPFLEQFEQSGIFEAEESFKQFTGQLLHPETLTFEVPESLEPILRDYQKHGFNWLKLLSNYGFGGVLADDMGLGKTVQSIAFIVSELPIIRANKQPVLIVCPSSLSYNWLYEFMQFAPEVEAIVIDGEVSERRHLLRTMEEHDVIITTYPLLRKDSAFYERQHFHTVFFDEAQAFKNPVTQTARTVKRISATNRFGLTGTPIENSLSELWSIYRVIFPQLFRELEEFRHMQRKDIARRVRPFLLRRMKEHVLGELPQKEEMIEKAELLPEQKALYAAYLAKLRVDTMKHLDKETFHKNRIRILAGITRLRQICCHPALFVEGYKGSSAKFEQLFRLLEQSKVSGRRVLIFSQFTQMLKMIATELSKRGEQYFYLDGQTPSEERIALCNSFNDGERDMFLISLKAGGTGLNLTGADTVILYDLWWNPAVEEQAADRAHRMGQKEVVQVIKLIANGTIEEKMSELQQKKKMLISDILDGDESSKGTLTEQDIREILMI
ncbi:superfamily II DNA/RNA helicase, SNF2 family [Solibacillus silvestris StLB046]|uniref:Superfamily II DNA/RNA helicase, SNF2 family n=1 Tax=Solibacillus silvestris (strain StLB046) TaxID=1002809 RepID=F2F0K4_SOLSS|nr:DEAD/DEAH box helicase [Solibacillus silvestris]BAK15779.1 superfamily II DNA/RNA helicase, SNF2 family [Solibacillus silvestris StLB046]